MFQNKLDSLDNLLGRAQSLMDSSFADLITSTSVKKYIMRGKRVDIYDKKFKYEDFFKLSVNPKTLAVEDLHKSSGVDTLAFAIYGLCLNLLSAGELMIEITGRRDLSPSVFLDLLDEVVSEKLSEDITLSESCVITADYNLISTSIDLSSSEFREEFDSYRNKSMFFSQTFGNSSLNPNSCMLDDILPKAMCLALRDTTERSFTEIFCKFKEVICLGGLSYLISILYEDKESFTGLSGSFDIGNGMKLTNNIGVSRLVALALVSDISESHLLPRKDIRLDVMMHKDIGNDVIFDYFCKKSIWKYVQDIHTGALIKIKIKSVVDCSLSDKFTFDVNVLGSWMYCICLRCCTLADVAPELMLKYTDLVRPYLIDKVWNAALTEDLYCKNMFSNINSTNKDLIAKNKEIDSLNDKIDTLNSSINSLRSENLTLQSKLDKSVSESNQIELLNSKLQSQVLRSNDLVSQVDELKLKLQDQTNAFDELLSSLEVTDIEVSEKDISLQEMIDMLNGFRFCFIGGRYEMTDKLNALGLHNFVQANNVSDIARLESYDFIVSMTSFVSHKMFYQVMSKLGSERNKHMYFNGTNMTKLVKSCYEFVTKYFEIIA